MHAIKNSVGKNGRNHKLDVLLVQELLNQHVKPPLALLVEDGIVGRKTIAAITDFQRKVVRMRIVDGRVDPGKRTIAALTNKTSSRSTLAAPPRVGGTLIENQKAVMQKAFNEKQKSMWWQDFWKLIVTDITPETKRFFSMIGRAEEARQIANFYLKLREMGTSPKEIKQVLQLIVGSKNIRWTKDFVAFLAEPTGPAGDFLNRMAKAGKIVGFVAFLIEYIYHWSNGDYHMAVAEVYKASMGEAIPWAGYIDTIQSFAGAVLPNSIQKNTVFKIIKAIDPIGLGAQGIDFIGVTITAAIEGKIDENRVDRLAKRIKSGPTAIFYDIGDDLATALSAIAEMSDEEFYEMMSAENIWGWLNDFWLTKYTPSLVLYRYISALVSS